MPKTPEIQHTDPTRAALILALMMTACNSDGSFSLGQKEDDPVEIAIEKVKGQFPPPKKERVERVQISAYCTARKYGGRSRKNHVKLLRGVIRPKCKAALDEDQRTRKNLNRCVREVLNSGVLCRGK